MDLYPVSIAERHRESVLEILYFVKYLKIPGLCVIPILSEQRYFLVTVLMEKLNYSGFCLNSSEGLS